MEPSLTDESPSYAARVTAYLKKNQQRRLPWGTMVVGGHLAPAKPGIDRAQRYEVGEVAISLLEAMGVPMALLEALVKSTPWNVTPAELLAKVEALRARPMPSDPASAPLDIL